MSNAEKSPTQNETPDDNPFRMSAAEELPTWDEVLKDNPWGAALEDVATAQDERRDSDMVGALKVLKQDKIDRFRRQRIQEIAERELNARLLTVDRLEEEVLSENPEVKKRVVPYGAKEITVYDLEGFPFAMLTHAIDYRRVGWDDPSHIGSQTAKKLLDNPSVWDERRDIAEMDAGFGTTGGTARGDTISTSFTNSEHNLRSRIHNYDENYTYLIYGFDHVDANSVILVSNGDGGTINTAGTFDTQISDPEVFDYLEGENGTGGYNEILIRRYSENGMAKRPNYIIAENGVITEAMLRHAAFFGVPIININMEAYDKRMKERGKAIFESMEERGGYKEFNRSFSELRSMSMFKNLHRFEEIGLAEDFYLHREETLGKIEILKRIDFIEETLKKATISVQEATDRDEAAPSTPAGFKFFHITIFTKNGSEYSLMNPSRSDADCDWISIDFRLDDGTDRIMTKVYDGQHKYGDDQIPHQENANGAADSSFYERLRPLAEGYIRAIQENQKKLRRRT